MRSELSRIAGVDNGTIEELRPGVFVFRCGEDWQVAFDIEALQPTPGWTRVQYADRGQFCIWTLLWRNGAEDRWPSREAAIRATAEALEPKTEEQPVARVVGGF